MKALLLHSLAMSGGLWQPLVDRLTFQWFVKDLDLRASLIANTVEEPLRRPTSQREVEDFLDSATAGEVGTLASSGIRVNTIAPGVIETPMLASVGEEFRTGLAAGVPFPRRLGRPEEFAQLVVSFLDNDYLNGTTVRMDGALRMAPR